MKQLFLNLWKDEDGPTAVEYALMLATIAGVIILAATFLGTSVSSKFTAIGTAVTNAPAAPVAP